MDRFEYEIRAKEIVSLYKQGEYAKAVKIVDTIDWRRVQGLTMLYRVSDIYRHTRRYEESRDILLMANEISPNTKRVVYALCELSIYLEDPVKAVEYFEQYKQIAPHEVDRFILQYKIYESHDVSLEERIAVLEKYKMYNYDDPNPKWTYELAYLYHRIGLTTRCVEECDELILWFGDGEYVYKALELKMLHAPLTPTQQEKYNARFLQKREDDVLSDDAVEEAIAEDVKAPMGISVKNVAPTKAKTTRIPSLRMGWKNRAAQPAQTEENEDEDIRIAEDPGRAKYKNRRRQEEVEEAYEEASDYPDPSEQEYADSEDAYETEELYDDEAYEDDDAYEEVYEDAYEDAYEEQDEESAEAYEDGEYDEEEYDDEYEDDESYEEEEYWEEEEESEEAYNERMKTAKTTDLGGAIGSVVMPEKNTDELAKEAKDRALEYEKQQKEADEDADMKIAPDRKSVRTADEDMRVVTPDVEEIKIRTIDAGNRFDTINLEEETSKYLAKEIVKLMEEDDMEAADATRALPMNSIFHDSIDSLEPHVISRAMEMAEEMNNERLAREAQNEEQNGEQNKEQQETAPEFGQEDMVEIVDMYSEEEQEAPDTKSAEDGAKGPADEDMVEIFEEDQAEEETSDQGEEADDTEDTDMPADDAPADEAFEEDLEDVFDVRDLLDDEEPVFDTYEDEESSDEEPEEIETDDDMVEITEAFDEDFEEIFEDEEESEEETEEEIEEETDESDEAYEEEDQASEDEEYDEEEDFETEDDLIEIEESEEAEASETVTEPEKAQESPKAEKSEKAEEDQIEPIVFSQSKPLPKEFIEAVQIVAMEAAKEAAAAAAAAAATQVAAAAASQAAAAAASQVAQASATQAAAVARQAAQEAAAATADAMKEMQPPAEKPETAPEKEEAAKEAEEPAKEPEAPMVEKQITGQLSFRDIIAEWEDVKKATEQKQIEEIKQKVKEQSSPLLNNFDNTTAFEHSDFDTISPVINVFEETEDLEKEVRSALAEDLEEETFEDQTEEKDDSSEEEAPKAVEETEPKEAEEEPEEEVFEEEAKQEPKAEDSEQAEPEETDGKASEKESSDEADEDTADRPNSFNTAEINGLEDKLVSALAGQHYDTSNLQAEILQNILHENEEKEEKEEKQQEEQQQVTEEAPEEEKKSAPTVTEAAITSAAAAVAMAKAAQIAKERAAAEAKAATQPLAQPEAAKEPAPAAEAEPEKAPATEEKDVDKLYEELMKKQAAEAEAARTTQEAKPQSAAEAAAMVSSQSPAAASAPQPTADGEEDRVLTKEERDLFSHVANGKQMQQRLARIIDQATLEPLANNIRVVGENGTDPELVCREIVQAIGLYAPSVSSKMTALTAEQFSGKDIDSYLEQYNDGALIIEQAGSMTLDTCNRLFTKAQTLSGLLIVFCDNDENMQRLSKSCPKVEEYATQKLVVDVLDNDGLVKFAQAYAKEKEYSIDEMGRLALYNRIEERQRQDHAVTTVEVKGIVDSAIEKADKKNFGHFMDVVFAKRYDKEDMVVLREKDFMP